MDPRQTRAARAEHYRSKAEETRIIGEGLKDAEARRFLMTVAQDYLMLARLMERCRTRCLRANK